MDVVFAYADRMIVLARGAADRCTATPTRSGTTRRCRRSTLGTGGTSTRRAEVPAS